MPLLSDESYVGTVPGLHAALIEKLEADAAVVDPRIKLMDVKEILHLCYSAPGGKSVRAGFGKEITILNGDPDSAAAREFGLPGLSSITTPTLAPTPPQAGQ